MSTTAIGLIGVLLSLILFSYLCYKGAHVYVGVAIAIVVVCLFNRVSLTEAFSTSYWPNFTNYIAGYWWIFVGGGIFGAVLNATNGSISFGRFMIRVFGKHALLGFSLMIVILTYCGLYTFGMVTAFIPMMLTIFKKEDIPRRFIPIVFVYGVLAAACILPGAILPHNMVPARYFGFPITVAPVLTATVGIVELALGYFFLLRMIDKAHKRGEHYSCYPDDFPETEVDESRYPAEWKAALAVVQFPILVIVLPFYLFFNMIIGSAVAMIILWGHWDLKSLSASISKTVPGSVSIMLGQCAVMGFGTVFTSLECFKAVVNFLINIPGTPLISCALATTIMSGLTGSATSGINITLPALADTWTAMSASSGISLAGFARVCGISSLCIDTMPHNGALNGLLLGCREKMKDCYPGIFVETVVVPGIGTILAIILFSVFKAPF